MIIYLAEPLAKPLAEHFNHIKTPFCHNSTTLCITCILFYKVAITVYLPFHGIVLHILLVFRRSNHYIFLHNADIKVSSLKLGLVTTRSSSGLG